MGDQHQETDQAEKDDRAEKECTKEMTTKETGQAEQEGSASVGCPDQAEQASSMPKDDIHSSSATQITQTVRQCPTTTGPVARYVFHPYKIVYNPIVTQNIHTGTIPADGQDRAELQCKEMNDKRRDGEQDWTKPSKDAPGQAEPACSPEISRPDDRAEHARSIETESRPISQDEQAWDVEGPSRGSSWAEKKSSQDQVDRAEHVGNNPDKPDLAEQFGGEMSQGVRAEQECSAANQNETSGMSRAEQLGSHGNYVQAEHMCSATNQAEKTGQEQAEQMGSVKDRDQNEHDENQDEQSMEIVSTSSAGKYGAFVFTSSTGKYGASVFTSSGGKYGAVPKLSSQDEQAKNEQPQMLENGT